jgi:hypothetical protein
MSKSTPAIKSIRARALVTPMARPVKNAFGVIDVAPLLLIDVATDQGVTGRSYLFAYSKLTLKPFVHLVEEIGRELVGKPVVPYDLMAAHMTAMARSKPIPTRRRCDVRWSRVFAASRSRAATAMPPMTSGA